MKMIYVLFFLDSRSDNTYTKTSNIDLDEYKQTDQRSK